MRSCGFLKSFTMAESMIKAFLRSLNVCTNVSWSDLVIKLSVLKRGERLTIPSNGSRPHH